MLVIVIWMLSLEERFLLPSQALEALKRPDKLQVKSGAYGKLHFTFRLIVI